MTITSQWDILCTYMYIIETECGSSVYYSCCITFALPVTIIMYYIVLSDHTPAGDCTCWVDGADECRASGGGASLRHSVSAGEEAVPVSTEDSHSLLPHCTGGRCSWQQVSIIMCYSTFIQYFSYKELMCLYYGKALFIIRFWEPLFIFTYR